MPVAMEFDVAVFYGQAGRQDMMREYMQDVVDQLRPVVEKRAPERLAQDNPYLVLLNAYETLEQYADAEQLLDVIQTVYKTEPGVDQFVASERMKLKAQIGVKQDTTQAGGQGGKR